MRDMRQGVGYAVDGAVATIKMDDGKVNALSSTMLGEINAALDRAEAEAAVVVLGGRTGVFSAGFDLPVLRERAEAAQSMLRTGFELAERLLSFPVPVVIACSGHAIAMGAFLVLSGDYRIGASGTYKITANEVAIGLTLPRAAVEICRQRLSPAGFNRAVVISDIFSPEEAVTAGFLDRAVPAADLAEAAAAVGADLTRLDLDAHAATKLRARQLARTALREAIDADEAGDWAQVAP